MSLIPIISREKRRSLLTWFSAFAIVAMIVAGVFAKNGWFPNTDGMTGEKTGWFGSKLPKNAM